VRPRPAPERLDDASRRIFAEHGREAALVAVLVVPIVMDGRIEAFLTLDNFEDEDAFDADAVEMARVSAALAATILFRLRMEGELERLAYYDGLTGLPNRTLLLRRLASRCDRPRDPDDPLAVLLLDLDDLKPINDSFGHDVGDQVIRAIAERLTSVAGEGREVARIGGDEFVVVADTTMGRAEALAGRLLDEVHAPVFAADHALRTSASVGIALAPRHATTPSELLRRADVAMHHAKTRRAGHAVSVFRPEMDAAPLERVLLEEAMHAALEREEFVVHYQPRVRMDTGRIVGVEALVRWRHPERGLVPPGLFVPLAESTRLIVELGRYVLTRAARQARAWRDAGHHDLRVSVNLSAREVEDPELPSIVRSVLATHGLPGEALEFEILERSAMHDLESTTARLDRLHDLGCHVALDDFGVGHSSLGYLQHLHVDALKIDRSFVAGVDADPSRRALVEAITRMGHTLGHVVVAEGVETLAQWRRLSEIGVDEAQGFLLAPALPASDAGSLLAAGPLLPDGLRDDRSAP
jgi:diguanylate cyclase (GGDEF)-like protein